MQYLRDFRHVSTRNNDLNRFSAIARPVRRFPQLQKFAEQIGTRHDISNVLAVDFGDPVVSWDGGESRDAYLFPKHPPSQDFERPRDPEEIYILFIIAMTMIAVASYFVVLARKSQSDTHSCHHFPAGEK